MGTHGLGVEGTWLHEAANAGLRVLVATEPGLTQMRMELKLAAGEALPQYDIYYTTGLNVGTAASPRADGRAAMAPDRRSGGRGPVCLPPASAARGVQHGDELAVDASLWSSKGVRYGQKDVELRQVHRTCPGVPAYRSSSPSRARTRPSTQLRAAGWRIRHALQVTASVDGYLAYIADSQGEFGVCKHACVATNTGWFSERSAAYLASGRPVVMQETGFSRHLPCGRGLFAVAHRRRRPPQRIDEIDADWERHARWARDLAREYLDARNVLGRMLQELAL